MADICKLEKEGKTIWPGTVTSAVIDPSTSVPLDSQLLTWNIPLCWPEESGEIKTLEKAVEILGLHLPAQKQVLGTKVEFISEGGNLEAWEFNGGLEGGFENVSNWKKQSESEKLDEVYNKVFPEDAQLVLKVPKKGDEYRFLDNTSGFSNNYQNECVFGNDYIFRTITYGYNTTKDIINELKKKGGEFSISDFKYCIPVYWTLEYQGEDISTKAEVYIDGNKVNPEYIAKPEDYLYPILGSDKVYKNPDKSIIDNDGFRYYLPIISYDGVNSYDARYYSFNNSTEFSLFYPGFDRKLANFSAFTVLQVPIVSELYTLSSKHTIKFVYDGKELEKKIILLAELPAIILPVLGNRDDMGNNFDSDWLLTRTQNYCPCAEPEFFFTNRLFNSENSLFENLNYFYNITYNFGQEGNTYCNLNEFLFNGITQDDIVKNGLKIFVAVDNTRLFGDPVTYSLQFSYFNNLPINMNYVDYPEETDTGWFGTLPSENGAYTCLILPSPIFPTLIDRYLDYNPNSDGSIPIHESYNFSGDLLVKLLPDDKLNYIE